MATVEEEAEERWTTVRHLVWQGWLHNADHLSDQARETLGQNGALVYDSGRYMVDEDGGLWHEARPDVCEERSHHTPRWHPAEIGGHHYCMVCGKQGVPA